MKNMKQWLFFLFGLLCTLSPLPAQERAEVDSLYRIVCSLPYGQERLTQLATLVRVTQMMPDGLKYSQQLYAEACRQQNDTMLCTAATYAINNHYSFSENAVGLDSIRYWSAIGIPVAKKLEIWQYYFEMKKTLTCSYIFNNRFEFALEEARGMAEEAEKIDNMDGLANAYLCMGMAYQGSKRWKECWEMYQKAHGLFEKGIYATLEFNILFQMIDYLYINHRYRDILPYIDETRRLIDSFVQANPYLESALSGSYMLLETYTITAYSRLGHPEVAGKRLDEAKKRRRIMSVDSYDKFFYEALCDYYMAMKQFDKAVAYGDSAQVVIEQNGLQTDDLINHLERQADLYYTMGDYDGALPLYQRGQELRDSLNRAISDRQMVEIQELYKVDWLQLKENQMRQRVQWVIICIAGVILVVVSLFWRRNLSYNRMLRQSTEATQEAVKATEEANERKRRFLATMSHAIRVPLNSVVGFSQLLSADAGLSDEERAEYGCIIRHNTEQLMFLVNSVLDLSRLEAGMTKWQMADYDLFQLMRDAVGSVALDCPHVSVSATYGEGTWPMRTDTGRMMQVFVSLLAGTVTTTHAEAEEVKMTMRKGEDGALHIVVDNSPLANLEGENQENTLRHDINRLTLNYFGGSYEVDYELDRVSVTIAPPAT